MTNLIHLYVIETNLDRAKSLGSEVARLPQVTVLQSYTDAVAASGGLDAIFVPLMSALDWGGYKTAGSAPSDARREDARL